MTQTTNRLAAQRATSNNFGKSTVFVPCDTPGTGYYKPIYEVPSKISDTEEVTTLAAPQSRSSKIIKGTIGLVVMWSFAALFFWLEWNVFAFVCSVIFGLVSIGVLVLMFSKDDKKKETEKPDTATPLSPTSSLVIRAREQIPYIGEEEKQILENFVACLELSREIQTEENTISILEKENSQSEQTQNMLAEHKQKVAELESKLAETQIDVDKDLSESERKNYFQMCEAFEKMRETSKMWYVSEETKKEGEKISSVTKSDMQLAVGAFDFLKSNFDVPVFVSNEYSFFFYPKYIIRATDSFHFEVFPHSGNTLNQDTSRFHESEEVPADAKQISTSWLYLTPTGEKDESCPDNREIPILRYHRLNFKLGNNNAKFMFSSATSLKAFGESFENLNKVFATDSDTEQIFAPTAIDFATLNNAAEKLFAHICDMSKMDTMKKLATKCNFVVWADEHTFAPNAHLAAIALFDAVRCYEKLGFSLYLQDNEALALALFILKIRGGEAAKLTQNEEVLRQKGIPAALETIELLKNEFGNKSHNSLSLMIDVMKYYKVDSSAIDKYAVLLYRWASVVAKTDGVISQKEKEFLEGMINFAQIADKIDLPEENSENETEAPATATETEQAIANAMKKLDDLIGLEPVKEEMKRLSNFVKVQRMRADKGLATSQLSYHCVFTGNPGTGKTTVARILAEIYKSYGVVSKGHLVETDRSGLVAEYVGQTAVKTNKIIDEALDGILFIDEAYSLVAGGKNDYGMEAISTLLKRMEDDRARLVVVLAGYSKEMKDFIDTNPGLQSRFNRYISFSDYNAEDLLQIFKYNMSKCDYELTEAAEAKLRQTFEFAVAHKDKNFGNGRYARNILEKVLENQAMRLAAVTDITEEKLCAIEPEDIP